MINLVTPDNKQRLLSDYRRRRLVVAGYLLLLVLIIGVILLSSFYFSTNYRRLALEKVFRAESGQAGIKDSLIDSQSTTEINNRLAMFKTADQTAGRPFMTLVVRHLIGAKTSEIKITALDYTPNPDNTARLNISGQSASRKSFAAYVDKLRTDPLFTAVESPVSNLISEVGGNFNIVLSIAPVITSSATTTR